MTLPACSQHNFTSSIQDAQGMLDNPIDQAIWAVPEHLLNGALSKTRLAASRLLGQGSTIGGNLKRCAIQEMYQLKLYRTIAKSGTLMMRFLDIIWGGFQSRQRQSDQSELLNWLMRMKDACLQTSDCVRRVKYRKDNKFN